MRITTLAIATQTMMMLRASSRVASLPRAASLGVRRLCMHDDFKPKVRSYAADGEEASVHAQIEKDVKANKVVVFMKGVPDQPQCGFSNTVVQILKAEGTSFKGFNVLADPDLREGIKSYSNWPTIPQVYVDGEFIGGCDTTMEMCAPAKFRRNSERRRNFLRANLWRSCRTAAQVQVRRAADDAAGGGRGS